MGEYIEREAAIRAVTPQYAPAINFALINMIQRVPAADVRPVVHSKWILFPNDGVWDFKCDICHRIIPFGQTPDTMKYCPNCGADMRAEGE